ncbi:hypothetical protein [Oceanobacter mangrovi]|uniref:hypothetical protein n=1 Tax=Oceanobacter mangrovi TaxID=2862510 RepID=UPI001C8DDD9F|nr:hypothetical protein [Oceanobacter mangrovi]
MKATLEQLRQASLATKARSFALTGLTAGLLMSAACQAAPLQLRLGPAANYPVITDLPSDSNLIPLKRQLDWLYVKSGEYEGWISVDELMLNPDTLRRPEPLQFRDQSDENHIQLDMAVTSESALALGINFRAWEEDLTVRLSRSVDHEDPWYSASFGKRFMLEESESWSWDAYLGGGLSKNSDGSRRWDDDGDSATVPYIEASADLNWNLAYNVSFGGRVQVQQALSGNSANHGALALVWKIRF